MPTSTWISERIASPPSWTPTPQPTRVCRRTPRSAFPSWAIRFELETRTASRVTMDAATSKDSVADFVAEIVGPGGWTVGRVRQRSTRFEPPDWYWSSFNVDINKDEDKRTLRLVTKGAMSLEAWERMSGRLLTHGAGRACDPVDGTGYPRLFPDTRHAYWFYPYDLSMHNLPAANDKVRMASALFGLESPTDVLAAARRLEIERVRYVPEVGSDERIRIEDELGRLDRVTEQFAYVLPAGHFLLKDLVTHMRERVRKTEEEDWLPTHGDMKYDQFMLHNDHFTLLDFDYFALAETSYDLVKFCAYAVPSMPLDWRQSVGAEEARLVFMRRYRELRPYATLDRFGVYEALHLALRALSFMWAQVPEWDRMAEGFLVLAFERLKSRLPE